MSPLVVVERYWYEQAFCLWLLAGQWKPEAFNASGVTTTLPPTPTKLCSP